LKQFFMSFVDFLEMVELLLLCSFSFLAVISLFSWTIVRAEAGIPTLLWTLSFLCESKNYLACCPVTGGCVPRVDYTLGLLFLCELRRIDFVGGPIGIEWLIFLMRLLTIAADDLRGSYRLLFLLWSSRLLAWLFIFNIHNDGYVSKDHPSLKKLF
jgi:hypothetical protein